MNERHEHPEIQAMADCYAALRPLGRVAATRVQNWLISRLGADFDLEAKGEANPDTDKSGETI